MYFPVYFRVLRVGNIFRHISASACTQEPAAAKTAPRMTALFRTLLPQLFAQLFAQLDAEPLSFLNTHGEPANTGIA